MEQGTFNAVFDTTDACMGVYTVRADDGERGIAEAEVEIGFAVPAAARALEVSINDELLTTPIRLAGSITVSVTVTTNGKPVEGAHVDLSTDWTDKRGFTSYGGDTTDRNGIFVAQWKLSDISQKNSVKWLLFGFCNCYSIPGINYKRIVEEIRYLAGKADIHRCG